MPRPDKLLTLLRLATLAVLATVLASCGSAAPPTTMQQAGGLPSIAQRGTVRVCSTGDYRPFTYRDPQGNWSGLDIEMAQDMAARLGVRLEVVPTTWANLINDLNGKCDAAMGGISITLNRAKQALYSAPYLRDGKAAIIRCADASKFQTLDDIDRPDVRVVVNPGGTNAEFDKEHLHKAAVATYPDNNTIFDQLTNNAADVMITDASEIRWQANQNPQLCGVSLDHPFTFEQKGYLVPQPATDVQQWMDQWLNIAQNDGTYAALSRKYLGSVIGP
ncbi:transporter substrate-binding domain-containing protein [Mycobacterium sp. NPDC048908]|uniref:transporter substrate-binding domain-containing protein n=1 Tax=Mycobacterium sp. NPDC048908 TaxID=3364292 RepID=UPI00370F86AD